jgi:hypothetical protein
VRALPSVFSVGASQDTLTVSLLLLELLPAPLLLVPFVLDPVLLDPVVLDPVVLDPVVLDPVVLEPVVVEPVVLEPPLLDPVEFEASRALGGVTRMVKEGSAAVLVPSLALIWMPGYSPASALLGVPESCPLVRLKFAQAGLFWMLKSKELPAGVTERGWNE